MRIPATCNAAGVATWDSDAVRLRCVIVDDDGAFLQVARALLERQGITVEGIAHGCADAVERARMLRPDVVLIDIRLGEESGFEVARRLAGNGHARALIMISTHGEADYAELIADSPVAGFLPKSDLSAAAIHDILRAA
jgi:DNA-binding NarL/FixJ family response regulator